MSAYATPDAREEIWRVGNETIEQALHCPIGGRLTVLALRERTTGFDWAAGGAGGGFAPWAATVNGRDVEPSAIVTAVAVHQHPDAIEAVVSLSDTESGRKITYHLWAPHSLPVFRTWIEIENAAAETCRLDSIRLLRLVLPAGGARGMRTLSIENFAGHRQDKWDPTDGNFRLHEQEIGVPGQLELDVGAYRRDCSWLALQPAGESSAGLVVGLEYDGASRLSLSGEAAPEAQGAAAWELAAWPWPERMDVVIAPGERFRAGAACYGLFRGEWDQAAHVTHRLVEEHLGLPVADDRFPYVIFNTWHYTYDIDQEKLTRALDLARDLGVEVFDVDLGWCRAIGDWRPNERFPDLADLGQQIKQRGMKFGIWMAFANAAPDAPVLEEHPDWTCAPDDWGSFKTRSLCLAHEPVRRWVVRELLRVIDTYGVDWLKHDFELITPCARPGHTHPPSESDIYSVQGFHAVLEEILQSRPHLMIENCQGGGRLMTYDMVRLHHTSITGDGAVLQDALLRRQALYGATYPFPPRFCDNYMEEAPTPYACRSSMIGGPWILMHAILDWTPEQIAACREHIALYKEIRAWMRDGQVFHLAPPTGRDWDAFEAYHPGQRRGVVLAFRPDVSASSRTLPLRGLAPAQRYRVRAYDSGQEWTGTGAELIRSGIPLVLPDRHSSEVLLIEPV